MSNAESTRLIQRLKKPRSFGQLGDNPFSFGGGYKNGGLSDEAMALIRDIFSFDYMGAAEFEFGAVPEALRTIAQAQGDLIAFSFTIPLCEVAADFRDKSDPPEGDGTVYVLCPQEWSPEVERRIRSWAGERYNRDLKETTRLAGTLRPHTEWDGEIQGWLELNNGFMFFTDEDMWAKTCDLFGVER